MYLFTTTGEKIKLDRIDYEWAVRSKWSLSNGRYALRWENKRTVYLHREIMARMIDFDLGTVIVDHINRDSLDNRRKNLRLCTQSQSSANRSWTIPNKLSRYKGVTRHQNKWRARITVEKREIHLGGYDTEVEAALAYDTAAIKAFGQFAVVNFPCQKCILDKKSNKKGLYC